VNEDVELGMSRYLTRLWNRNALRVM